MLEFADFHKIVPWAETGRLDLEGIQYRIDRLKRGLTRHRYSNVERKTNDIFVATADNDSRFSWETGIGPYLTIGRRWRTRKLVTKRNDITVRVQER